MMMTQAAPHRFATTSWSSDLKGLPAGHVRAHQRLEEPTVAPHAEVQHLVRDDVVLKAQILIREISG